MIPLMLALASVARAAYGYEIPFPCKENIQSSCGVGLQSCPALKQDVLQTFRQMTAQKVRAYYRGIDLDWFQSPDPVNHPQGSRVMTPICNLAPNEFNGFQPEIQRPSVPGATFSECGELSRTNIHAWRSTFDGGVDITIDRRGTPYGLREASWYRGARMQTLVCHRAKLMRELDEGKLPLRAASPNGTLFCKALAEDVHKLYKRGAEISKTICEQGAVADIELCKKPEDLAAASASEKDKYRGKQAGCFLIQGRLALEAAFKDLIMCEYFWRADKAFLELFDSAEARERIEHLIKTRVSDRCEDVDKFICGETTDNGCHNHVSNLCYRNGWSGQTDGYWRCGSFGAVVRGDVPQNQLPVSDCSRHAAPRSFDIPSIDRVIREYIEEKVPSSGDCRAGISPFFLFGSLFGVGRRRRGDSRRRRGRLYGWITALPLAALVSLSGASIGCGGAPSVWGPGCATAGGDPVFPTSCCGGGSTYTATINPPAGCPGLPPDDIGGFTGAGITAANTAESSFDAAASLQDVSGAIMSDRTSRGGRADEAAKLTQGQAARLSNTPANRRDSTSLSKGTGASEGGTGDKTGPSSGSGGGGTASGGGGGMGPASIEASGGNDSAQTLSTNVGGAVYAGGGGGGGQPATQGALYGSFGQAGGGGGGSGGSVDFEGVPHDGTNPMGSQDPDDYLSKIDSRLSLFRIVEARYRQKSTDWMKETARDAIHSAHDAGGRQPK